MSSLKHWKKRAVAGGLSWIESGLVEKDYAVGRAEQLHLPPGKLLDTVLQVIHHWVPPDLRRAGGITIQGTHSTQ